MTKLLSYRYCSLKDQTGLCRQAEHSSHEWICFAIFALFVIPDVTYSCPRECFCSPLARYFRKSCAHREEGASPTWSCSWISNNIGKSPAIALKVPVCLLMHLCPEQYKIQDVTACKRKVETTYWGGKRQYRWRRPLRFRHRTLVMACLVIYMYVCM